MNKNIMNKNILFNKKTCIYKLINWIDIDKIDWTILSKNINAMYLLENNLDKVNWWHLSRNKNAIHILEKNIEKIRWDALSSNMNAINILEKNLDKKLVFFINKYKCNPYIGK